MKRFERALGVLAVVLFLLPGAASADRPKLTRSLVLEGRASFSVHCAGCHGPDGRAPGEARNLALDEMRNGRRAEELFTTLSTGIAGTHMPSFAALPERELWGLCYRVKLLHASGRSERRGKE